MTLKLFCYMPGVKNTILCDAFINHAQKRITTFLSYLFFQSLKNSHKCVGEVGFLQVKVIKANDLPATDLNGNM